MQFDDDADLAGSGDADAEEPESPIRASGHQQQTPRRGSHFNAVQDSDDENMSKARSKGKTKATNGDHDGDVEEEIAQGLEDVDMQQVDDDEVVTPKKKPKEKRPRKKRTSLEDPCMSPSP